MAINIKKDYEQQARGVRDLVIAEVLTDTKEGITFGEVVEFIGAAEVNKEIETSVDTIFFDDAPRGTVKAEGVSKITINGSRITDKALALITDNLFDESTGAYMEGPAGGIKYFALGYITSDLAGRDNYIWAYKGIFSTPAESNKTKDNSTDTNGTEIEYSYVTPVHTFTKGNPRGTKFMRINSEDAAAEVDLSSFFTEVTTPDNIKKIVPAVVKSVEKK